MRKMSFALLALLIVACGASPSWSDPQDQMAGMTMGVGGDIAADKTEPKTPAAADACDPATLTDENIAKHNEAVAQAEGTLQSDYPNLLSIPGPAGESKTVLCPKGIVWSLLRGIPKRRDLFLHAAVKENQFALIRETMKDEAAMNAKLAELGAKAAEIHKKSEAFARSVVEKEAEGGKPKRFETNLSATQQKKVLEDLIEQTGVDLVGPGAPNAERRNSVKSAQLFTDYYKILREFARIGAIKDSIHPDWVKFWEGTNNDPDNQIVGREMMRCLYYGDTDLYPNNAKLGALNKIAPELGKEARKQFYRVRDDLNAANQAAKRVWKSIDKNVTEGIAAKLQAEQKARDEKSSQMKASRNKISGMLADKLFDGSTAAPEEREGTAALINARMKIAGDKIVVKSNDGKGFKTMELTPAEVKDPGTLSSSPRFQELVNFIQADNQVKASLTAAGLAVNPPKEDAAPTGPLDATLPALKEALVVKPIPSAFSPDQQKMIDAAKAGGPGCTTNSQDKFGANEEEKIAAEASKRLRDGKNADKDLDRSQKDLAKAQRNADEKAGDEFKKAMAPYEKLKAANKITPADYQAALDKETQARKDKGAANLLAYNQGMEKANGAAVDAVTNAGTEQTIATWKKEKESKIKDNVDFLYNTEITAAAPEVRKKFTSADGRKTLDPDLANFDPSGFIPAYLTTRWSDPPAALNDAKAYIKDYNQKYPLDAQEVGPGVNMFVPKDFQTWLTAKQAGMTKPVAVPNTPKPPEDVKPGAVVEKENLQKLRDKINKKQ